MAALHPSTTRALLTISATELHHFMGHYSVHEAQCATWAHRSHSGFYLQRADDACGVGACKHIAYIADLPWIVAVHQKLTA